MNYFKQFPREIFSKGYMLVPSALLLYLAVYGTIQVIVHIFTLQIPIWGVLPFLAYFSVDAGVCAFSIKLRKLRAFFMFPIMHLSYGAGMFSGLFKNKRRWK